VPRLAKALAALALAGLPAAVAAAQTPAPPALDANPCLTQAAVQLRCPDLVMKRPHGLRVQRRRGRRLLRAGNSIDSIGAGPAELHGRRTSRRYMRARQRIYKRGGGRIGVRTGARLQFKLAHEGRRYWKFHRAARFELWRLDGEGNRIRRVRVGPKVSYCLRDLRRTRSALDRSPRRRVYPACSTSPRRRRVTIGTSVGWSDIYPPGYPEQWINVTGLRGCFHYVHLVDPGNGIYEANEHNNAAWVRVRLPYRGRRYNRRCPGRDSGAVNRERGPYY